MKNDDLFSGLKDDDTLPAVKDLMSFLAELMKTHYLTELEIGEIKMKRPSETVFQADKADKKEDRKVSEQVKEALGAK